LPVSGMLVGLPASSVRKSEADSCPVVVDGVKVTVIVQLSPDAGKGNRGDCVKHVVVSEKSAKLGLVGAIPTAAKYSGTLPIFTRLMGAAATGTPTGWFGKFKLDVETLIPGAPVPVPVSGITSSSRPPLKGGQLAKEAPPQILLLLAVSTNEIWPVTDPTTSGVRPNVKVQMSPGAMVKLGTLKIGELACGTGLLAQLALERKNWFEKAAG
jgi:hypothetical protein